MELHDAYKVIEIQGEEGANAKLAEGWKLLTVFAGANSQPWYVLGKTREAIEQLTGQSLA